MLKSSQTTWHCTLTSTYYTFINHVIFPIGEIFFSNHKIIKKYFGNIAQERLNSISLIRI